MNQKENASPEIQKDITSTDLILKDLIWTEEKIKQKSAQWFSELEPLCKTDLEIKLARSLTNQQAIQCNHAETIKFQDELIAKVLESYDKLFCAYNDLCRANDENKRVLVDIGGAVDKRFNDIVSRIEVAGL